MFLLNIILSVIKVGSALLISCTYLNLIEWHHKMCTRNVSKLTKTRLFNIYNFNVFLYFCLLNYALFLVTKYTTFLLLVVIM